MRDLSLMWVEVVSASKCSRFMFRIAERRLPPGRPSPLLGAIVEMPRNRRSRRGDRLPKLGAARIPSQLLVLSIRGNGRGRGNTSIWLPGL